MSKQNKTVLFLFINGPHHVYHLILPALRFSALKNGIENYVGVPDSTLKHFISRALEKKKIIITTREEEAIGIASGMSMSGSNSVVFMQNAGFANSISTITSLTELYEIPIIFFKGAFGSLLSFTISPTKALNV